MNGCQVLPSKEDTTTNLRCERTEPDVIKWPVPNANLQDIEKGEGQVT